MAIQVVGFNLLRKDYHSCKDYSNIHAHLLAGRQRKCEDVSLHDSYFFKQTQLCLPNTSIHEHTSELGIAFQRDSRSFWKRLRQLQWLKIIFIGQSWSGMEPWLFPMPNLPTFKGKKEEYKFTNPTTSARQAMAGLKYGFCPRIAKNLSKTWLYYCYKHFLKWSTSFLVQRLQMLSTLLSSSKLLDFQGCLWLLSQCEVCELLLAHAIEIVEYKATIFFYFSPTNRWPNRDC